MTLQRAYAARARGGGGVKKWKEWNWEMGIERETSVSFAAVGSFEKKKKKKFFFWSLLIIIDEYKC